MPGAARCSVRASEARRATYRLQLRRGFDLDAAASLVPYLAELGVSHLYCSPVLQAVPGSTHGYDVVDPSRVSDELGGIAAWRRFVAAASARGLRVLLDIVPNHMAAHRDNPWWWDVLEDGVRSPYAGFFDVDWSSGAIVLPVLGDHVERVMSRGELRVERRGGRVELRYHDVAAPVSLPSLARVLHGAAAASGSAVLGAAAHGASRLARDGDGVSPWERLRQRAAVWSSLADAAEEDDDAAAALDAQLATVGEDPAALEALLRAQNHRLAWWRTGLEELNYRRFFDISSLVGLRVEDPAVFDASHRLVLDMVRSGDVDGLRIDHVDGLRQPAEYLQRLRARAGESGWIVVEKILGGDERLPSSWPVEGTTGYEFAALVTRLQVDPRGEQPLMALHASLGGGTDLQAEARAAKLDVMRQTLAPDVTRLAALLQDACAEHLRPRDVSVLHDAVSELLAAMPVYRTYVVSGVAPAAPDVACLQRAVAGVRRVRPDISPELLALLESQGLTGGEFAMRFQQLAAAVMAKGMEDTAFYRFTPLAALDEVGCAPQPFAAPAEELHRHNAWVQEHAPETLLAGTTHDTKRGEDVRARLVLLSEMPSRWADTVRAWRDRNARYRRDGVPEGTMEHLLYQSMVGAWPVDRERMLAYMEKASREANTHTSWVDPVPSYDAALRSFVEAVYADEAFLRSVEDVVAPLVPPGRVNALAQLLLRLTSPGVPDLYQGSELWTLSLVDPDNRRSVDYALRRRLLASCATVPADAAWSEHGDGGLPKLLLTRRALALRARRPSLFGRDGAYHSLRVRGARADHVVAFARGAEPGAVSVVPRLVLGLGAGSWEDTAVELPAGAWWDQVSGAAVPAGWVPVAELLREFPVALLAREAPS